MKSRKWVLQNHAQDADWTVLEQLTHRDEVPPCRRKRNLKWRQ